MIFVINLQLMKKILIVDDDLYMIKTMKDLLSDKGFATCSAYNGQLALTCFQDENPDAVLLDINMPEMDGMEVLQGLREIEHRVPVVMFTAINDIPTAVEATRCGAFDFITKPPDMNRLVTVLNQAVDYKATIFQALSSKEKEILELCARGKSKWQIGETLGISENTVKFHIKKIMEKLGAKNITQALAKGIEKGIIRSKNRPPEAL